MTATIHDHHPGHCGCGDCRRRESLRKAGQRYREKRRRAAQLADLFDTPHLDGAACVGRHHLFDAPEPGEDSDDQDDRLAAAKRLCLTRCPALDPCRQWLNSLPQTKRPTGTVAGRLITEETR